MKGRNNVGAFCKYRNYNASMSYAVAIYSVAPSLWNAVLTYIQLFEDIFK